MRAGAPFLHPPYFGGGERGAAHAGTSAVGQRRRERPGATTLEQRLRRSCLYRAGRAFLDALRRLSEEVSACAARMTPNLGERLASTGLIDEAAPGTGGQEERAAPPGWS